VKKTKQLLTLFYLGLGSVIIAHPVMARENLALSVISQKKIVIKGNERVTAETIQSYIYIDERAKYRQKSIDESLKKLYESELFFDVKIYQKDSQIIVKVQENPLISEIKFIGNKKISEDILQSEISLKKRSIFTKSKLRNDIKRISDIYLKSGRFLTKIEPKIITKEQNRIELIFDIYEGKKADIGSINFIGNNIYTDRELLDEITTKQSHWYRFFSSSDSYDSDHIEFDKEKLRRFYTSRGYADFSVISSVAEITPNKSEFLVNFLLEEGPMYKVKEVEVVNKIDKIDTALLNKAILIKKGKIYNEDLIEKTIDKMMEDLSDNGYAFAIVDPVLKKDQDKKTVNIDFVIEETPRIYINQIHIFGNVRTTDKVILRELRFREGDPYNITRINRSRQRILNLDFFDKVEFQTKRIGNSDKVDIEISVKEKKTGALEFSVGYSTLDGMILSAGYSERNLLGTGQVVAVTLQRSSRTHSVEASYTKPYFMNRPIDAGFDVFDYQRNKQDSLVYDQESKGFALRGDYSITEFLGHQIKYSYHDDKISNIDPDASYNIQHLYGQFKNSTIEQTFSYNRLDSNIDPRDGYVASITQAYTGLGGDIHNIKHEGVAAYYLPIVTKEYVLKLLVRGGIIQGIGQDVRSNDGFYLGGDNFRGFQYAGLGPRTISKGADIGGDAIGGKIYYMSTAEFRFPIGLPKELGISGSLFTDIGTVRGLDKLSKEGVEVVDTGSLRASYGLSLSWSTPLGLLRLDFSRAAKKEVFDRPESFRFSIGTKF
jgi:outer membrane protein insertion porin family